MQNLGNRPLLKILAGGAGGTLTSAILAIIAALMVEDWQAAIAIFIVAILPVIVQFATAYLQSDPRLVAAFAAAAAYEANKSSDQVQNLHLVDTESKNG